MFFRALKNRNWKFIIMTGFFGLFFSTYFIINYALHISGVGGLRELKDNSDIFYDRYTDLIYAYSYMREKLINNNSLDSFITDDTSAVKDIMQLNFDRSLHVEKEILAFRSNHPSSIDSIVKFVELTDSENLCDEIIMKANVIEETDQVSVKSFDRTQLKDIRSSAYQTEIKTIIEACTAASKGRVDIIARLHD